jgi:hypothetical protein
MSTALAQYGATYQLLGKYIFCYGTDRVFLAVSSETWDETLNVVQDELSELRLGNFMDTRELLQETL